ncbi:MAG TPA: hypothetical protein VKB79_12070 [Bryobacteraceae bacterium]|nr:hypothetical protein [Bryobacteraceae bacterium]
MDKRLLFPAVALTAWAQASPEAADAEKALRERAQQFYQLQLEKKYRQAEAMVADDTKDDYYASKKPDIKGFTVDKVELAPDLKTAKVIIKAKVTVMMPGAGAMNFDLPTPTEWKLENGEWRWYISHETRVATPFGDLHSSGSGGSSPDTKGAAPGGIDNPNVQAIQDQISISKTSVRLSRNNRQDSVSITNGLPGPIDLRLDSHVEKIKGLSVEPDKTHLTSGETAVVLLRMTGDNKFADHVDIVAQPLNRLLRIEVTAQ